jgi:hypothetical protein
MAQQLPDFLSKARMLVALAQSWLVLAAHAESAEHSGDIDFHRGIPPRRSCPVGPAEQEQNKN